MAKSSAAAQRNSSTTGLFAQRVMSAIRSNPYHLSPKRAEQIEQILEGVVGVQLRRLLIPVTELYLRKRRRSAAVRLRGQLTNASTTAGLVQYCLLHPFLAALGKPAVEYLLGCARRQCFFADDVVLCPGEPAFSAGITVCTTGKLLLRRSCTPPSPTSSTVAKPASEPVTDTLHVPPGLWGPAASALLVGDFVGVLSSTASSTTTLSAPVVLSTLRTMTDLANPILVVAQTTVDAFLIPHRLVHEVIACRVGTTPALSSVEPPPTPAAAGFATTANRFSTRVQSIVDRGTAAPAAALVTVPRLLAVKGHYPLSKLHLFQSWWLHAVPCAHLASVTAQLECRCFAPGELLLQQGRSPPGILFLRRGVAEIRQDELRGRPRRLLGAGTVLGERSATFRDQCREDVVAFDFCDVWLLPNAEIHRLRSNAELHEAWNAAAVIITTQCLDNIRAEEIRRETVARAAARAAAQRAVYVGGGGTSPTGSTTTPTLTSRAFEGSAQAPHNATRGGGRRGSIAEDDSTITGSLGSPKQAAVLTASQWSSPPPGGISPPAGAFGFGGAPQSGTAACSLLERIVRALRTVTYLRTAPLSALVEMALASTPEVFTPQSALTTTSTWSRKLIVLTKGQASAQHGLTSQPPPPNHPWAFHAGSCVGLECVVRHRTLFSICSVTMVEAWSISRRALRRVLKAHKLLSTAEAVAELVLDDLEHLLGQRAKRFHALSSTGPLTNEVAVGGVSGDDDDDDAADRPSAAKQINTATTKASEDQLKLQWCLGSPTQFTSNASESTLPQTAEPLYTVRWQGRSFIVDMHNADINLGMTGFQRSLKFLANVETRRYAKYSRMFPEAHDFVADREIQEEARRKSDREHEARYQQLAEQYLSLRVGEDDEDDANSIARSVTQTFVSLAEEVESVMKEETDAGNRSRRATHFLVDALPEQSPGESMGSADPSPRHGEGDSLSRRRSLRERRDNSWGGGSWLHHIQDATPFPAVRLVVESAEWIGEQSAWTLQLLQRRCVAWGFLEGSTRDPDARHEISARHTHLGRSGRDDHDGGDTADVFRRRDPHLPDGVHHDQQPFSARASFAHHRPSRTAASGNSSRGSIDWNELTASLRMPHAPPSTHRGSAVVSTFLRRRSQAASEGVSDVGSVDPETTRRRSSRGRTSITVGDSTLTSSDFRAQPRRSRAREAVPSIAWYHPTHPHGYAAEPPRIVRERAAGAANTTASLGGLGRRSVLMLQTVLDRWQNKDEMFNPRDSGVLRSDTSGMDVIATVLQHGGSALLDDDRGGATVSDEYRRTDATKRSHHATSGAPLSWDYFTEEWDMMMRGEGIYSEGTPQSYRLSVKRRQQHDSRSSTAALQGGNNARAWGNKAVGDTLGFSGSASERRFSSEDTRSAVLSRIETSQERRVSYRPSATDEAVAEDAPTPRQVPDLTEASGFSGAYQVHLRAALAKLERRTDQRIDALLTDEIRQSAEPAVDHDDDVPNEITTGRAAPESSAPGRHFSGPQLMVPSRGNRAARDTMQRTLQTRSVLVVPPPPPTI